MHFQLTVSEILDQELISVWALVFLNSTAYLPGKVDCRNGILMSSATFQGTSYDQIARPLGLQYNRYVSPTARPLPSGENPNISWTLFDIWIKFCILIYLLKYCPDTGMQHVFGKA